MYVSMKNSYRVPVSFLERDAVDSTNYSAILCKRSPEGSQAGLDHPRRRITLLHETKNFRFKVFEYKVSTLDPGFKAFPIRDESGNFSYRIHVLWVNAKTNPVSQGFVFPRTMGTSAVCSPFPTHRTCQC